MDKYILNGKKPVKCKCSATWARWFDRRVALTKKNGVLVSTVFLGIDHRFGKNGPPILFETMVFGGPFDQQEQVRYCTWKEAEAGHAAMCKKVLK